MFGSIDKPGFSIWLKPIFKCLDEIIDCEKSSSINYPEIKSGDILELEYKDSGSSVHKQIYISTSNWSNDKSSGSFITLTGKQILLSDKILNQLKIFRVGTLKV